MGLFESMRTLLDDNGSLFLGEKAGTYWRLLKHSPPDHHCVSLLKPWSGFLPEHRNSWSVLWSCDACDSSVCCDEYVMIVNYYTAYQQDSSISCV